MATQSMTTIDGVFDGMETLGTGTFVPQPRNNMNDLGLPATDGTPVGGGGGAIVVYTMRAVQNGSATVYWENDNTPDNTGAGPNAPGGTLTDIGIKAVEFR